MSGEVESVSRLRSALDERLLKLARRSPQEIADELGLEPAFVAQRVAELLVSRDWLSERQEERLLLVEAAALKDRAFSMLDGVEGSEFAQVANVVLRSLKLVAERLDARRKLVDADLDRISSAHARLFGEAFDVALNHIVGVLGADVEPEVVDGAVADGLRLAGELLSKRVVD
jgi:DNA-binding Lrp family transcriptional regulator